MMYKIAPERHIQDSQSQKLRFIISRDMMFAGKETSHDNKSADNKLNDLVDEGYESEDSIDSCTDISPLVCRSDSRMSISSSDSDYQIESDEEGSDDNEESVLSSRNSEDDFLYDDNGYESEDSCTHMPDLTIPSQQVINAMKKLDTSYNPIARSIIAESRESVRPLVNQNTKGTITSTI